MKIDHCFWYKNHAQFKHTNHVKEKENQLLLLILKLWHKPINKMDLKRETRITLTEKKTTT